MLKATYICDICGAKRKEANHWFSARLGYARGTPSSVTFQRWEDSDEHDSHLCGQECVHKMLDKWMSEPTSSPAQSS